MPELPEVETVARRIEPHLVGRTIVSADIRWARTIAMPAPKKFQEQINGRRVLGVSRRAKYVVIRLDHRCNLLVHLRMSGDLNVKKGKIIAEKHDRLLLTLRGKRGEESFLAFNDVRKFGRVWLTDQPEKILGKLGPEPLGADFTPQWLYENLQKKKRALKPLLLDQHFLAGVGNIYADEALHIAKLHPLRLSNSVTRKEAAALHRAVQTVLIGGIRNSGSSIDWMYRGGEHQKYFRVYGREGKPCPRCGDLIQKIRVAQRGAHFCPTCQPLERK
ncbi:MAG: bifunctional DNA-formamidopyrimidine glycosylase/DNA-(apurinic or apyrimidinic site) lyase [Anaerolineales bacterium]|nr:bifunctional DNA-formamidopyrimidine glycosylase/DNA-(apurinic or apyrimidinic site) lyase [Anaerolineales bacterium]